MPEFHLPRLSKPGARSLLDQIATLPDLTWTDRAAMVERWTGRGDLGAREATQPELQTLRDLVVGIAVTCGFPDAGGAVERARFDTECAKALTDPDRAPEAEALRDDVWAWVALVLLPDVVRWRFGSSEERYRGGVRNTFQRLWLRGAALDAPLDENRWRIVEQMTEDAQVQVFERPGLSASIRTARVIGEVWTARLASHGSAGLEDLTRRAMIGLRVANQILSLDALDDATLHGLVERQFQLAAAAPDA